MTAEYVLSSALWALGGLVCGYLLGRAVGKAKFPESLEEEPMPYRATRMDNLLGILLITLSVISVVTLAITIGRQEAQVQCQTTFNQTFTAALRQRTEAANTEREGQRNLLAVALNPDSSPEERRQATQRYYDALVAADAQRQDNPLPDTSEC